MIKTIEDVNFAKELTKIDNSLFLESSYNQLQFEDIITNEQYEVIAYFDEQILGYAVIYHNYDSYELFKIGVKKDSQHKGIGNELMKYIQSKTKKILLEVSSQNEVAIDFYKKHNFVQNGLRKNYYGQGNDGILMEWNSDF